MSETMETVQNAPNWSRLDMLKFWQERDAQRRRLQIERDALKAMDKRAKESGLPLRAMKIIDGLGDDADIILRQLFGVGIASGVCGPQTDLLEGIVEQTDEERHRRAVQQAQHDGWDAGRGGLDKDSNPHKDRPGSEECREWLLWWERGHHGSTYVNGGVAPVRATREQPKARLREYRPVSVLSEPVAPPSPVVAEAAPEPTVEYETEPTEEFAVPDFAEEPAAPVKKRGRPRKLTNGDASPGPKRRGRPPGSKNKAREMHA